MDKDSIPRRSSATSNLMVNPLNMPVPQPELAWEATSRLNWLPARNRHLSVNMGPLSAVSLAVTVVHYPDLSVKLITKTTEI